MTEPRAEKICSHNGAAANTIVDAVGDADLLVPAANGAVSCVGESHEAIVSTMSKSLQQQ